VVVSNSLAAVSREEAQAPQILVVAGEASGDSHASGVVRSIIEQCPEASVFGMGGSALRSAGMELVIDSEESASVMGLTEVLGSAGKIIGAYKRLLKEVDQRKPNLAILVDFPDFNLFLARALKRKGVDVLYYISPQLWAWRSGRVHTIRKYVRKVIPIFPFEEIFYRTHGVEAEYLGHPFLDRPPVQVERDTFLQKYGISSDQQVLAILPGSRTAEVERLLKPLVEAFNLLRKERPGLRALLPVAATLDPNWVKEQVGEAEGLVVIREQAREVLHVADAAVVASGTATVEAALAGVPFVVVYKLSPFTFAVARRLVRGIEHVAMANLIMGKRQVTELLQHEVNGPQVAKELKRLLADEAYAAEMRSELAMVYDRLSLGMDKAETSTDRVARVALGLCRPEGPR